MYFLHAGGTGDASLPTDQTAAAQQGGYTTASGMHFYTHIFIMRPSSLRRGRILRRTLSVCPSVCLSVCPSVCPSVPLLLPSVTSRHLANYNDARAEGRISYGHLGRTSLFLYIFDYFRLSCVVARLGPRGITCSWAVMVRSWLSVK